MPHEFLSGPFYLFQLIEKERKREESTENKQKSRSCSIVSISSRKRSHRKFFFTMCRVGMVGERVRERERATFVIGKFMAL